MDLIGKVVVVTGGAGGIGLATVKKLLIKKAKVCILDILEDLGRDVVEQLRKEFGEQNVLFIKCDVTHRDEFNHAFDVVEKELGPVDVLYNNAGIHDDLLHPERMVAVNLVAVMYGTLIAIERMRKDRGGNGGVVINISSMAGIYPYWIFPGYSATKAGVLQFTRAYSLSEKQKEMGIRFNVVCPATVMTERQHNMTGKMEDVSNLWKLNNNDGYIVPEDVADLICRLIEEDLNGIVAAISKKEGVQFVDLPIKKLF